MPTVRGALQVEGRCSGWRIEPHRRATASIGAGPDWDQHCGVRANSVTDYLGIAASGTAFIRLRRRFDRARLEELSTDVIAETPDDLVAATLRKLVWRKEQHELIGNFKAVRLQPDAAVGKVFYEAGTFCARAAHDRGHASKLMARCSTPLKHACGTRFLWSGDDPHLKWIAIHRCKPANERPRVNFKFDMALEAPSRRVV
jgi:hypothetical protein